MAATTDVCIIGAGLAGLACAGELAGAGVDTTVVEATDRVGGRVATDAIDGFLVDRGFQILLTAYPEAHRQLDLDALDLCRFEPGALVFTGGRLHRVADPLRRPGALLDTLRSPIGTPLDKLRILRLVLSVRRGAAADLLGRPDRSTLEQLDAVGFSDTMIDRFFRPLFSGIQLDPHLEVSARRFAIILRMLAVGDTAVPAKGMAEIPRQLATALPEGAVRLRCPAEGLDGTSVRLATSETIQARAVVVATDGPTAVSLLPELDPVL
ncbi:MAG: FAD-dependent oxidoreductase, partial [Acidimicrobiales bacterium]|nr:FAD-dependent oxidoreductase [Acidimicrobiales bacterium]